MTEQVVTTKQVVSYVKMNYCASMQKKTTAKVGIMNLLRVRYTHHTI